MEETASLDLSRPRLEQFHLPRQLRSVAGKEQESKLFSPRRLRLRVGVDEIEAGKVCHNRVRCLTRDGRSHQVWEESNLVPALPDQKMDDD